MPTRLTASRLSLAQKRWVRVAIPASIRPPPPAQEFHLDRRMRGAQAIDQHVCPLDLSMIAGAPVATARRGEVPVVIPFEIGNRKRGEERVDRLEQMIANLGAGHVEDQLIAAVTEARPSIASAQSGCVRYRSLSGLIISGSTQRPNSMLWSITWSPKGQDARIFPRVDLPVAKPGAVVVAAAEPAVVEDEPLDAHPRRAARQRHQRRLVLIEVEAFPAVEVDRPRPHRPARPIHPLPDGSMEVRARAVEAGRGKSGQQFGVASRSPAASLISPGANQFAGRERPGAAFALDREAGIARPGQLDRMDFTRVPTGALRHHEEARGTAVTGQPRRSSRCQPCAGIGSRTSTNSALWRR